MGILSFFTGKNKTENVAEVEKISLEPAIEIPEPTRKELFESAVLEVATLRVTQLIRNELDRLVLGHANVAVTSEARSYSYNENYGHNPYGCDGFSICERNDILSKFPDAYLEESTVYPGLWRLGDVSYDVHHIASKLAEIYIKKDALTFDKVN